MSLKIIILNIILFFKIIECDEFEYNLLRDLMQDYNPLERPVSDHTIPIEVSLSITLQQLMNLDEKTQVIELNAYLKYIWKDYKLCWKPSEYGGITNIRFPFGTIWRPDILLYNSAGDSFDTTYESNMVVYNDGTVNWLPPGILKSSCKMDITWFPFDDQHCFLKFGSWTYNGVYLDLQAEQLENNETGMDTSEYTKSGQWLLLRTPVERIAPLYDYGDGPKPYPQLFFYLHLRRRTLYYGLNIIIPSLVISLMVLLGFILPSDACEKITLEITVLLAIVFFLDVVKNMTPATSEAVPLIVVFFTCCMLVVSASIVFTVMVINFNFRTTVTHEMTPFVRKFLLNWLPWLLMMKRPYTKFVKPTMDELLPEPIDTEAKTKVDLYEKGVSIKFAEIITRLKSEPANRDQYSLGELLESINKKLVFITTKMQKFDDREDMKNDWKFAAMVVDRLCLVIFSILFSFGTCAIMISAPHLEA